MRPFRGAKTGLKSRYSRRKNKVEEGAKGGLSSRADWRDLGLISVAAEEYLFTPKYVAEPASHARSVIYGSPGVSSGRLDSAMGLGKLTDETP